MKYFIIFLVFISILHLLNAKKNKEGYLDILFNGISHKLDEFNEYYEDFQYLIVNMKKYFWDDYKGESRKNALNKIEAHKNKNLETGNYYNKPNVDIRDKKVYRNLQNSNNDTNITVEYIYI